MEKIQVRKPLERIGSRSKIKVKYSWPEIRFNPDLNRRLSKLPTLHYFLGHQYISVVCNPKYV